MPAARGAYRVLNGTSSLRGEAAARRGLFFVAAEAFRETTLHVVEHHVDHHFSASFEPGMPKFVEHTMPVGPAPWAETNS
jgi:hypothetical protein